MYEKYFKEFDLIAEFTSSEKGVTRTPFSLEDYEARKYIIQLFKKHKLEVFVDDIGNIFGINNNYYEYKKNIMIASHIDTTLNSGKYKGIMGLIAGLTVIDFLKNKQIDKNIIIGVFVGREYYKNVDFIGSRFFAGDKKMLDLIPEASEDYKAYLMEEKIFLKNDLTTDVDAFLELTLEHGETLIQLGKNIGVIDYLSSATICEIIIDGQETYSGNTSVEKRHDALVSAALVIAEINDIAMARCEDGIIATVIDLKVISGTYNMVPSKAELLLEVRGKNNEDIIECIQEIKDAISEVTQIQDVFISLKVKKPENIVYMSDKINEEIIKSCEDCKLSYENLHYSYETDLLILGENKKAAMVILPNKTGVSYNYSETLNLHDFGNGVALMEHLISKKNI